MEAKRLEIMMRLAEDVETYQSQFKSPMPMQAVAQKYAKTLEKNGGFHSALQELEIQGRLRIEMTRSGKKLVHFVKEVA